MCCLRKKKQKNKLHSQNWKIPWVSWRDLMMSTSLGFFYCRKLGGDLHQETRISRYKSRVNNCNRLGNLYSGLDFRCLMCVCVCFLRNIKKKLKENKTVRHEYWLFSQSVMSPWKITRYYLRLFSSWLGVRFELGYNFYPFEV